LWRTNKSWAVIKNRNKKGSLRLSGRLLRFKQNQGPIHNHNSPATRNFFCSFWKKSNNRP
jgi:galactose mutarotase-like enzyme